MPRRTSLLLCGLAILCLAAPARADRIEANATCIPLDGDLRYRCDIVLARAGLPVDGAAFTVTPAMPSMPMAHNLPPAPATDTDTPGTYSAELQLEMPGDWTLTLDLVQPRRDRIVLTHSFDAATAAAQGVAN